MVVPPQTAKNALRTELKARRQGFVSELQSDQRTGYCRLLADHAETILATARTVALYHPIGAEIDPMPLAQKCFARGVQVALPHVAGRREPLRFLAWHAADPLIPGPFGVMQPPQTAAERQPDLIFAPMLGFDDRLSRIGYGAGYYDRAFAVFPNARRIGLAWAVQRCKTVPTDPWDIPLHGIITEQGWID